METKPFSECTSEELDRASRIFKSTFWKIMMTCPSDRFRNVVLPITIPFPEFQKSVQEHILSVEGEVTGAKLYRAMVPSFSPPEFCELSAREFFRFVLSIARGFRSKERDGAIYEEFVDGLGSLARWCGVDESVVRSIRMSETDRLETPCPVSLFEMVRMSLKESDGVIRAGIVNGLLQKKGKDAKHDTLSEEEYLSEMRKVGYRSLESDTSYDIGAKLQDRSCSTTVLYTDDMSQDRARSDREFPVLESCKHLVCHIFSIWRIYRTGEVPDK